MKILLTGASGFLGKRLAACLLRKKKVELLEIGRNTDNNHNENYICINNLDSTAQFDLKGRNCDVLIHCAAHVHRMDDKSVNPFDDFREVNTYGTLNLAQQAADAGVKRFIFISSIKVNGESTELGFPFKADDDFIPKDPYGLSKYEAEAGLRKMADKTGMDVVIIRPPLIYGPGVKANFASMMKWVKRGIPLPLGGIKKNKRSLVSADNLVDLITICIDHPNAANQTFLVSDDDDLSTSQLLSDMAIALKVPNRLIPIPSSWLYLVAKIIGKPAISQRLCGSLQVDISKTKELLHWQPPYRSANCLQKTASAFLENNQK